MEHTYNSLYQIPYTKNLYLISLIIIFMVSFIILCTGKVYSSYKTYGIYLDNHFYVDVPTFNSDAVKKGEYVKIEDKKYAIEIDEISDLQNMNNINYQTYSLKAYKEYQNKEVVEITFYYNKQRIIQKIIKLIF